MDDVRPTPEDNRKKLSYSMTKSQVAMKTNKPAKGIQQPRAN